jgi:hypothetical protein
LKERLPHIIVVAVDPKGSLLAEPDSLNDERRLQSYRVEGVYRLSLLDSPAPPPLCYPATMYPTPEWTGRLFPLFLSRPIATQLLHVVLHVVVGCVCLVWCRHWVRLHPQRVGP